ncbi:MAG: NrtA/SsuA/CpmA family ABC transporter substrate-binding protein [Acidimicrobiia bacterium]
MSIGTVTNVSSLALFVGVQQGFFLNHGLDFTLEPYGNGGDMTRAFQAGDHDGADASATTLAAAKAGGFSTVMYAPFLNDATKSHWDDNITIVARADSGIEPGNVDSFVGKTFGVFVSGTADDYLLRHLEGAGYSEDDVTRLNVPSSELLVALQNNDVDAIASVEPFPTQILHEMGDDAILIARGGGLSFSIIGLVATEDYLSANPKVVQAATDAVAQTLWFVRNNLDVAAAAATTWVPGIDPEVASQVVQELLSFDPRISGCTYEGFQDEVDGLIEREIVQAGASANDMLIDDFVEASATAFPEYFEDLDPIPPECG